ncbi:TolC family protein [Opitutus terrae]|uniref:Outer membrane efflux protein n=1 Tax=Opitutus terrae (strain DSM 11246 / JCM 15787 / PB90-1) TaxID=452637 RepID=B1ZRV6_OPITP|nr:TolC family protein [Opitutus terrae]ACB73799.1 outer membrane efflux protein [Opitutus terrae PB90-1]
MLLLLLCFLSGLPARAMDAWAAPVPTVAQRYVDEALRQNLALQAQALDLAEARARLAEVSGALQPRLDLVARYSMADGGRTIDIPVGDLLNGVYRTLNEYLLTQGRAPAFPQLENQAIPLLRAREQETKLRLVQPLYRPELTRGIAAARAAAESRDAQLAAYRRELRLAVLTAYHTYLQAETAVEILDSATAVTAEAVRTNRLLAEVDKVTEDRVLRAEADELAVRQQRVEAERDRNAARAYFNFLLNRPLATEIERASEAELQALVQTLTGAELPSLATDRREELLALQRRVQATEAAEQSAAAKLRPTLALAVEGGVQGTEYRTGGGNNFVQGSLVAEWNLWDGRQRRSELEQARITRRRAELEQDVVRQQLALQLQRAQDDYRAAWAAYQSAERRGAAATRAFEIVAQREREGMVAQLSFLDARNERTRADLNRAITQHRLFIAAAALDRAAALSPLP